MVTETTKARRKTSLALRGLEIPDAFMEGTLSAFCNAVLSGKATKSTVRRLSGKVVRLGMVSK